MSSEFISLLVQIPLVGAFILFTVMLLKEFRTYQENQQNRVLQHESDLQHEMQGFIDAQNKRWSELLDVERARRKEAMDQGFREVEVMVKSIDKLSSAITAQAEALSRHDAAASTRHAELKSEIAGLRPQ